MKLIILSFLISSICLGQEKICYDISWTPRGLNEDSTTCSLINGVSKLMIGGNGPYEEIITKYSNVEFDFVFYQDEKRVDIPNIHKKRRIRNLQLILPNVTNMTSNFFNDFDLLEELIVHSSIQSLPESIGKLNKLTYVEFIGSKIKDFKQIKSDTLKTSFVLGRTQISRIIKLDIKCLIIQEVSSFGNHLSSLSKFESILFEPKFSLEMKKTEEIFVELKKWIPNIRCRGCTSK